MSEIIIPGRAPRFHTPRGGPQVNHKLAEEFQKVTLLNGGRARLDKVSLAAILLDLAVGLLKRNNMTGPAILEMCHAAVSWQFDEYGGNRR